MGALTIVLFVLLILWGAAIVLLWKAKQRRGIIIAIIHLVVAIGLGFAFTYVYALYCYGSYCALAGAMLTVVGWGVWGIGLVIYGIVQYRRHLQSA